MAQGTSEQQKQQTQEGLLLFYFHSDLKKKKVFIKSVFRGCYQTQSLHCVSMEETLR